MGGRDRGEHSVWSEPSNLLETFRAHQAVPFSLYVHHGNLRSDEIFSRITVQNCANSPGKNSRLHSP